MKQKLFSMLVLLAAVATGAWAQEPATYKITVAEGTEDAGNWNVPAEAAEGSPVTATYSGEKKVKSVKAVKKGAAPKPDFLAGVFSVSSTKKVNFSKGNLSYASSKWSFFDNQYDYYASYSADAWDHFGWSTSATTYGMNTSTDNANYSGNFVDWGSNSDLQTALGTGWFTLSSAEWEYLFNTRSASTVGGTDNGRYAKAKVNDVQGLILFPDTYTHPDGVTAPTNVNTTGASFDSNTYTVADWTKMESAGCVFLPAAGSRNGSMVNNSGLYCYYWSATPESEVGALNMFVGPTFMTPVSKNSRNIGFSVRLVAPSFTRVTTFSELQTALSAGKDVKLMNDIVCTAEIEITSEGALTIDGNGKTLSTTSAIRTFTVKSSATVAFKNLTLTGFVNGGGPAINNSGTIVLDGCTISNCHVNNSNGGGAIESSGKLYAINTTFSGNYSGEIGGAINNSWGSLYMSGCTFTNNYTTSSNAFYGGAIGINRGSEVRLINCSFSGNKYGTNTGTNDIGVYNKPTNYTIAGCTGVTIASRADVGDITTNASGTATLDYSDLSNISFTYTAQ